MMSTLHYVEMSATRFWAKVDRRAGEDCWDWRAFTSADGYGRVWWNGRPHVAHRIAYEISVGPIPDGLTIDHLCRNTLCCNPAHLEAVTSEENVRRGAASITHCKRGHAFTPENTVMVNKGGSRRCRRCKAMHEAQHRKRLAGGKPKAKVEEPAK